MSIEQLYEAVESELSRYFTPRKDNPVTADMSHHGLIPDGEFLPTVDGLIVRDENAEVITWRFHGIDRRGLYGMAPTRRPVVIRGATIAPDGDPARAVHYVDWLDVYAQLGQTMTGRSSRARP